MQAHVQNNSKKGPPAVGERLHALRKAQQLSLDELSKSAGVSKSMLSQIERNEANPTVAVVWRLTNALGVNLAEFLTEDTAVPLPSVAVIPSHATPEMKSPDGKCVLRVLSPVAMVGKLEWYELRMAPGGALSSEPHQVGSTEHLSVLSGQVSVEVAGASHVVKRGETARYPVDVRHTITNSRRETVSALLVVEYG